MTTGESKLDFSSRMSAILSSIDTAQTELDRQYVEKSETTKSNLKRRAPFDENDSSSINNFKVPEGFPPNSNNFKSSTYNSKNLTPDFIKNPRKWTKYSLENTPTLSNKSNDLIAQSIMKELKGKHPNVNADSQVGDNENKKVVFKKQAKKDKELTNDDNTLFKKNSQIALNKNVKLDHLSFIEEDEQME